jgi:hypothetical protein
MDLRLVEWDLATCAGPGANQFSRRFIAQLFYYEKVKSRGIFCEMASPQKGMFCKTVTEPNKLNWQKLTNDIKSTRFGELMMIKEMHQV